MPLNLKSEEVDHLVDEIVAMTGETKTEAVRHSLADRRYRLFVQRRGLVDQEKRVAEFLERELWPLVPPEAFDRAMTDEEHEAILGLREALPEELR